jgi:hypothetical protein
MGKRKEATLLDDVEIDDDERALRIATAVHAHMSRGGDPRVAVSLIKSVATDGLEIAAASHAAKKRV